MAAHVLTTGFVHRLVGVSQVKHYVVVALIVTGRPVHVGVIVTVKAVRIEQSIEPISTPIAIGVADAGQLRLLAHHPRYVLLILQDTAPSVDGTITRPHHTA